MVAVHSEVLTENVTNYIQINLIWQKYVIQVQCKLTAVGCDKEFGIEWWQLAMICFFYCGHKSVTKSRRFPQEKKAIQPLILSFFSSNGNQTQVHQFTRDVTTAVVWK